MRRSLLGSNEENDADTTVDLANTLNIVAIDQPTVSNTRNTTKARKNNKYERRRRRAEQARNQKKNKTVENSTKQGSNQETNSTHSLKATPASDLDELTPKEAKTNNIKVGITSNDNEEKDEDKSGASVPMEANESPSGPLPSSKNSHDGLMASRRHHPPAPTSGTTPGASTTKTSNMALTVKQLQQQQLQREEHAKYLAEFHARPLELDRRMGATNNNHKHKSFESKHLFHTQSKWNTLALHPRLIQTLTEHISFQLNQPTTIQAKAIQTIWNGQDDSKDDPSNSNKCGSNFLLQSETGSGKTLAYLLPILQSLATSTNPNNSKMERVTRKQLGTRCIILCPTRELATQTLHVLEKVCTSTFVWLVPGGLTGGGDTRKSEKARIRKGLTIVVSTPGRLLDHLGKTEALLLSLKGKLEWLVLDECDRLLDMGLGDQVRQIVQRLRANDAPSSSMAQQQQRQEHHRWRSILVSATVTSSVQELAKERMLCGEKEWVWIKSDSGSQNDAKTCKSQSDENGIDKSGFTSTTSTTSPTEDGSSFAEATPRQLAQFHLTVSAKLRLATLTAFLAQRVRAKERTVIFLATCASVDYYYQLFRSMDSILPSSSQTTEDEGGIFAKQARIYKLHGSVPHSERQHTLGRFAKEASTLSAAILLATDVAARGLNLAGVDWTIQYDPPCEVADYVHRVGRVARAGKAGQSLIFLLPSEQAFLKVLEQKGIRNMTPLSLANTLNDAADICDEVAQAGMQHSGGGARNGSKSGRPEKRKNSMLGEAFCAEVQRRLEDCVAQEDARVKAAYKDTPKRKRSEKKMPEGELLQLARNAFLSHIRAYPTKEQCVKPIFSARALHLGHVARSFALKEPPKALASSKHRGRVGPNGQEQEGIQQPSSLEFREFQPEEGDGSANHAARPAKRSRWSTDGSHPTTADSSSRGQNAKALLLANATKLQNNGLGAM